MPLQSNLNHTTLYCSPCDRDIPGTPANWNFARNRCQECARSRPLLTIRLPPRKRCVLCLGMFPLNTFAAGEGHEPHLRCGSCRRRERCTKCHKIKRKGNFKRPSAQDENAPGALLKKCSHCRQADATRGLQKRQEAAAAGRRWCSACRKQVSEEDCVDADGVVRATCNHCRARRRAFYQEQVQRHDVPDDNDINEDIPDELEQPEGVDTVEEDYFDDDPAWMDVDIPEEEFLTTSEQSHFETFKAKLAELKIEACDECNEQDFKMDIRDSKCHRCRADRPNPVRKFCEENNITPGECPLLGRRICSLTGGYISNRATTVSEESHRDGGDAHCARPANDASALHQRRPAALS